MSDDPPSTKSPRRVRFWWFAIIVPILLFGLTGPMAGIIGTDALPDLRGLGDQGSSTEKRTDGGKVPAPTCEPAKFAPQCGSALWGIYTLQGATPASAVTDLEAQVGRRFDIVSRYHDFSDHPNLGNFPDDSELQLGTDRISLLSWQARVGTTDTHLMWDDVADGTYDAYIDGAATRIKAWNRPVIIAFDAEFDKLTGIKGPIEDYVRAYRHVVDTFRRHKVTNVAWAWVPTGYLGGVNRARTFAGYPGDSYVDWVGYDPFNFFNCNGTAWESFEESVSPMYKWLMKRGFGNKPFLLSEFGTQYDENNPSRSLRWHADIPEVVARYPNLRALVRFDADGVISSGARCDLWLDNGPGMLEAFAKAGRHRSLGFKG